MDAQHPGPPPSEGPSPARRLRVGQKVGGGRFALVQALGEGGMGVVWKAVDSTLGGLVALKFLPSEICADPTAIEDLRRETAQTRRLSHPNIVRVYDLYEDVLPFIYMEFVEGHTLSHERVRHPRGVLPWTYLAPYVAQLCDGLDYAHGEHVVHRDLKPANVLIDSRRDQVKLVDFGIAHAVTESVTRVTQKRPPDGSLVYMSCQQLNGEPVTPLDDIYSLGVTLYELLTSKPAFHSGDTAWQIRYGEAPPLTERLAEFQLENDVPPHVEAAVMACLARDPFKRPQSAHDVAAWLGLEPRPPTRSRPRGSAAPPSPTAVPSEAEARPEVSPSRTPRRPTTRPAPSQVDQPPAPAPEVAPQPAKPHSSRVTTWALVGLVVTAALYFVRVPPEPTGPPGPGTNYVRLYEVVVGRLANLISPSAARQTPPAPSIPAVGPSTSPGALTSAAPATRTTAPTSALPAEATPPLALASNIADRGQGTPSSLAVAPTNPVLTRSTPPLTPEIPARPTAGRPWTNSLGMRFAPVLGTRALFGVWETRRGDYEAFIQAAPAHRAYSLRPPPFPQSDPDEPAVKVSWSNAVAFCRWLTEIERQKGLLATGQAYRLPSDREWSVAVGLTNEPGRTLSERISRSRLDASYPWGAAWPPPKSAGNFRGAETRYPTAIPRYDDGAPFTSVVGRFGTNRFGLADLSGNVWEWCLPEANEPLRVARGGAWDTSDPRELRSAHRYTLTPGTELDSLGFRCVIDLGE